MKAAGVSVNCDSSSAVSCKRHFSSYDSKLKMDLTSIYFPRENCWRKQSTKSTKVPKLVLFFFLSGPSNVSYPEGNLAPSKFATRRWNYFLLFIFWYH